MVKRAIIAVAILLLAGVAVYVFFFRKDALLQIQGYQKATTPQICGDMFKKAIENREFEIAGEYCTAGYGEELKRGGAEAKAMAKEMDAMTYQMKERDFIRDETTATLFLLDPFWKDLSIVTDKESGDKCSATIAFTWPAYKGGQPNLGAWQLKPEMYQAYIKGLAFSGPGVNVVRVGMAKEKEGWKLDFPSDTLLKNRVSYLKEKHKHYQNAFETIKQNVKNDPTSRENATEALKKELESAAKE